MFADNVLLYSNVLINGVFITIKLALITIILSLFLGTFLGVLRYLKLPLITSIVTGFIELTRSIPLIIYIVFIHYTISAYIFYVLNFKNLFHLKSISLQSGIIALTLFTSAYIAEIVRSGLNSIDKNLIHSGLSLGLKKREVLRYIILPLALYRMTPALIAQFITLIKDTSLVSAIGLIELTRSGEIIYENTHSELEVLLVVASIYFILCFSLSHIGNKIGNKPFLTQNQI